MSRISKTMKYALDLFSQIQCHIGVDVGLLCTSSNYGKLIFLHKTNYAIMNL